MSQYRLPLVLPLFIIALLLPLSGCFMVGYGDAEQSDASRGRATDAGSFDVRDEEDGGEDGAFAVEPEVDAAKAVEAGADELIAQANDSESVPVTSSNGALASFEEIEAVDAALEDAATDVGSPDVSALDASSADAAHGDAEPSDIEPSDATTSDAEAADAAASDAATDAAETSDATASDAGSADAGSCATRLFGLCWHLGTYAQSCTSVCALYGGFDPRTASYVGSIAQGGGGQRCKSVLTALGDTSTVYAATRSDGAGLGCHRWSSGALYWLYNVNLSPNAWSIHARLACACKR